MAVYTLKNQEITIVIDSHGAELKSLKDNHTGTEYMWCGDAKYWGRTSPVLFPLVGTYKNNEITYQGKKYTMSQHGFARDMEFELVSQTKDSIYFSLTDTEATRAKYPFAFYLELGYQLSGRTVEVIWHVKNPSRENMYFSIGGHPAFNCPLDCNGKQTDYRIAFDTDDKIISSLLKPGTGVTDTKITYPLQNGQMAIAPDLFDNDALIIEHHQAHQISLVKPDGEKYIIVSFDAPLFGIWSPTGKNAPFICIEPWYGRADHENFTGTLEEREWGNQLAAGEEFKAVYRISI